MNDRCLACRIFSVIYIFFISFYIYSCHKSVWEMKNFRLNETIEQQTTRRKKKLFIFVCRYFFWLCVLLNGVSKTLSHRCYLDGNSMVKESTLDEKRKPIWRTKERKKETHNRKSLFRSHIREF